MTTILIQRLPNGEGLPIPAQQTAGSAGADISSADEFVLEPRERRLAATGFAVAIPAGYEIQIRPRSGLALKHGLTLPNSPATIDSDYRGELKIALINLGHEPVAITRGMRIAQLVVARVESVQFEPVASLPPSERGAGGFGSTGA
ncbi:MAG: dUTP diphosphatase [Gemmatimonadota bacterium]